MYKRKRVVGKSWLMDETTIKVAGLDRYLSREVDRYGNTVDFLLIKRRMKGSALKYPDKAILNNGRPRDKSGADTSGIKKWNERNCFIKGIQVRQCKYPNNIV